MRLADLWALLKDSWNAWSTDKAPRLGAALAYYTTFSLAPLLVIIIAIAALVFGREAVQGKIVAEIGGLIGTLGLYLGRSSMASAYGPAGSLVLILAWVYYSSLVLLLGAEFTEIYAHRYGSRATSAAAPPLPQPRESTPPVVPQGVRHVPSPGYGRYVTAVLIFVAGMILGARRRARYS
jgi:membrane protein